MNSSNNQVVAITGGGSGIGLGTAEVLAQAGYKIALIDINADALHTAKESLEDHADNLLTITADITDSRQMANAISQTVEHFGALDKFVANAGIRVPLTPFIDTPDELWDKVIRVNLSGVFIACREAARIMVRNKSGAMVIISSLNAFSSRVGQVAYCSSKAGANQLSRALALELAEFGIRVNSVCPGTVNTAMFKLAQSQDSGDLLKQRIYGSAERFRPGIPMRKIAEPVEVANAIKFLLSDDASHITGISMFVDGGESII
ncbi:SDR family NAD(P)-dependent oxidoreductase [Parapusillimonas granuli]|uniref:SDR family oxidoreductase n=1 Tax=Parapusillimonas granuli TaxID=380911 RepID=A0A853G150_9BURK|nr:SDR family NAD(P)-dependent oxidoreductase [Parapusillimonas granuli]MBB5215322.1 3-oxoacyl-[acyl-carrier protein] reductase [Parapusillimonas granuli]NYT50009.1 SDR family oxidoreductase [Parapusillimonas granuli]